MALPTSYLTSTKNLEAMLNAIKSAQAPEKFTQAFLESLEFKSTADRLVICVLKSIGFLDEGGKPTDRYFRFLDQTQSAKVLAEGVRDAYEAKYDYRPDQERMWLVRPTLAFAWRERDYPQSATRFLPD